MIPAHTPHKTVLDGETALLAKVDDNLAVMAAIGIGMPGEVEVLVNGDPSAVVRASVVSWPLAPGGPAGGSGPAFGILALLPLPTARLGSISSLVFRPKRQSARTVLRQQQATVETVAAAVGAEASGGLTTALERFVELLVSRQRTPARLATAATFIRASAQGAGFVELLGAAASAEIYLQGWAADLATGLLRAIAIADTPLLADLYCGRFERADIADRGHGFAAILKLPANIDPERLRQLIYRGRDGWRTLDLYERRIVVGRRETPSHVRNVLTRASAPQIVIDQLTAAAQRFDGRDTVSGLPKPVRLGVDMVVLGNGGSVLVSGWMLDPTGLVRTVRLNVGGETQPISDGWTRQARPDVTAAFAQDPLFSWLDPTRHGHGFVAFATGVAGEDRQDACVELQLTDGATVYFPLKISDLPPRLTVTRMLRALDPKSVTAASALERQIGPMLHSIPRTPPAAGEMIDIGFNADAPLSIVVGADRCVSEVMPLLALLALDPATRSVPIVLAGPSEAVMELGEEFRRVAKFYRLGLRLVASDTAEDVYDAMESGVAGCRSRALVLLSAHVLPNQPGWLVALENSYRQRREKYLISPTILCDDGSVLWAGSSIEERQGTRDLVNRFAGYAQQVVREAHPAEVTAGTLDCCILPRAALIAAEGFSGSYIGAARKAADMALRIRLSGTPALWLPSVSMIGSSQAAAGSMAERLDRWSFERHWSLALSNLKG